MCAGYRGPLHKIPDTKEEEENLQPSTSLKDLPLKMKIEELLFDHIEIDTSQVKVAVTDGLVFLSGLVDCETSRATIVGVVKSIDGIEKVINRIHLD